MPSAEVGADVRRNRALNCCPWVRSLTQSPVRRNPFARRNYRCVADYGHELSMSARLRPQHAEAVLGIVERYTLDETRQHFLGR